MKTTAAELARDLLLAAAPKDADATAVYALAEKIAAGPVHVGLQASTAGILIEQPEPESEQSALSVDPFEAIAINADQEGGRFVVRIRSASTVSMDLQVIADDAHRSVLAIRAVLGSRSLMGGEVTDVSVRNIRLPSAVDADHTIARSTGEHLDVVLPISKEAVEAGTAHRLKILAEDGSPSLSVVVEPSKPWDEEGHEIRHERG